MSVIGFNGHFFPGEPGLASTRMSPFWILLDLRIMVVVSTGAIRRAKLQSNCQHQQTNTQFFAGRMLFLSPHQQHKSIEGKLCQSLVRPNYNANIHKTPVCLPQHQSIHFAFSYNSEVVTEHTMQHVIHRRESHRDLACD